MRPLTEGGSAAGPAESTPDLAAAVTARARQADVRWVWPSSAALYPALLRAGVRVTRCHDIQLTEGLLASHGGRPPGAVPSARRRLATAVTGPAAAGSAAGPGWSARYRPERPR